jgi:hypothetical protein
LDRIWKEAVEAKPGYLARRLRKLTKTPITQIIIVGDPDEI